MVEKALPTPQTEITGFMSLEVELANKEKIIRKKGKEFIRYPDEDQKSLLFFGWDVDGMSVDNWDDFENICISSVVNHFRSYALSPEKAAHKLTELTPEKARQVFLEDPNLVGKKYIEKVAWECFTCSPEEDHIKKLVSEVQAKLSAQIGEAMPFVKEAMWKLDEMGIYQYVCTNAKRSDAISKLEHAELLEHLDLDVIIGSDSGRPGEKLLKGRPQLKKIAKYYAKREVIKGYDEFTRRAGYGGDMVRDVVDMAPENLKLIVGLADKATTLRAMIRAGKDLPPGRFQVLGARNIPHIPSMIDFINRRDAAANFPSGVLNQK